MILARLRKGEVRNLIRLPEGYGKKVTVGGVRSTFLPTIEVSVYKDKWGRYTVVEKGHRLTPQEKRLGLKRTRSGEARMIAEQFKATGPMTSMRKLTGKKVMENRMFRAWEVNSTKGWMDIKRGSFVGMQRVGRTGEMESLMHSLDATTAAINNGWDFTGFWESLDDGQRFKVMQRLQEVDWENFWNEYIDSDGTMRRMPDEDKQTEGLETVMGIMQDALR